MTAITDAYVPAPALMAIYSRTERRGYVRMKPADIPESVRRRAFDQCIGGPADEDDGGYCAPATVTIFYLVNWRDIIPKADRAHRFVTSFDPPTLEEMADHFGLKVQLAICAKVYPVLRG